MTHGVLSVERPRRTGQRGMCERCGESIEALFVVPARRWTWRHTATLSPFKRRALAGLLPPKALA